MSKRKKNGKKADVASTLGFVAVLLIFVMLTGSIFTLFSSRGNTGSTVPGGTVTAPASFGGEELLKLDFANIEYSNTDGLLYQDHINSSVGAAPNFSAFVANDAFYFSIDENMYDETLEDAHFGFGIASNLSPNYNVSDFDYLTLDVRYTLESIYNSFDIYCKLKDVDGQPVNSINLRCVPDPENNFISITTNDKISITVDGNELNVTYVYHFDHINQSTSSSVYINGEYLTTRELSSEVASFCTLRYHFNKVNTYWSGSVKVDRVEYYTFGNGDGTYSGAIRELFEDPSMKLSECTDSIHYKR